MGLAMTFVARAGYAQSSAATGNSAPSSNGSNSVIDSNWQFMTHPPAPPAPASNPAQTQSPRRHRRGQTSDTSDSAGDAANLPPPPPPPPPGTSISQ